MPVPALPSPKDGESYRLKLNEALKLDQLGPIVINTDGTLSRIANWHTHAFLSPLIDFTSFTSSFSFSSLFTLAQDDCAGASANLGEDPRP